MIQVFVINKIEIFHTYALHLFKGMNIELIN